MTELQKVIKYLSLGFAIFLIIVIFSGIIYGVGSLCYIFSDKDYSGELHELPLNLEETSEISSLKIEVGATNLKIRESEKFNVETNNDRVEVTKRNGTIYIREKGHANFFEHKGYDLIVYLPKDITLNMVEIDTGAGKTEIESLVANTVNLDMGAGKFTIDYIKALSSLEVDGGAGEVTISNGEINNIDADMGVGKFSLKARLTGRSEFDLGVGETSLRLIGTKLDYSIVVDKGLGDFRIDSQSVRDGEIYGTGASRIDVSGGVGKVDIRFE